MPLSADDRAELHELAARYALLVDSRDLDSVVALFTEDGVLVLPEPPRVLHPVVTLEGRDAVRRALSQVTAVPRTFHALTGAVHDHGNDAGTATGVVGCVAHHLEERSSGDVVDHIWHVRYADSYRHTDSGWRFSRRRLAIAWIETRRVHRWAGPVTTGPGLDHAM